ncbi:MAG: hypothetical protein HY966_07735 [Ignavibacteriales bacterium]|nr:hypothetical protein [Ignavibacteriales bacterium]
MRTFARQILCAIAILVGGVCVTRAQTPPYFYQGRDHGSESLFNPWNLMLNGGFDILQSTRYRELGTLPYGPGAKNVFKNLADPFSAIRNYGVGSFIRDEIFPLSLEKDNGQWWPNYTLHLIGGGRTYRAMAEWFAFHGYGSSKLLSAVTMAAYHFVNEALENQTYDGYAVDPIADIYIFDLGGILLFESESVCKFFSSTLNLADWSLQPSYLPQNNQLHNNGQYFSMKWKLPFAKPWHVFYYFGLDGLVGLSYTFENGKSISASYGLVGKGLRVLSDVTNKKTVDLVESLGFFYDDENNLLASMVLTRKTDYTVSINFFPGIFRVGKFNFGGWFVVSGHNGVMVGLTTAVVPGLGMQF